MAEQKKNIIHKGLKISGASEALRKNIQQYPTYKDLQKHHTEHFRVKEKMRSLGL